MRASGGRFSGEESVKLTRGSGGAEKDAGRSERENGIRASPGSNAERTETAEEKSSGRLKPAPPTLLKFGGGIRGLGVDAAEFDGEGYAVQGQHVGGDPIVGVVGAGVFDDGVETFVHDLLQALIDHLLVPEEALAILHPIEVGQ